MDTEITWYSPFPVEKIYAIAETLNPGMQSMVKLQIERRHKANTRIINYYPDHMTYFDVFESFNEIHSQLEWEIMDLRDRKYSSDTIDKRCAAYNYYFKQIVGVFINMGGIELLRTQPTPDHIKLADRLEKYGV